MRPLHTLAGDRRGGSAAEFAMVLPLLLILMLGMIDVGRYMWMCNRAEKATQMGVRFAVVTDMVPSALAAYNFTSGGAVMQGDPVPAALFSEADCSNTGCTCTGSVNQCGFSAAAFTGIYNRMRAFLPELAQAQVRIQYINVGLGYAGDPGGPDVAPLVRVSIRQGGDNALRFQPITLLLFQTAITLPTFSAELTLEDGQGATTPN